ncbi:uncharacterized protein LOC124443929 [Xenia sp. Carnegie-2017]|uniref:uncharacterized protein LOC124443929 n=1 Tax=Xenia sp. Carnegie-2017 TaxID=2897299 RepID=UPI001F03B638|nr:uncharacterized protein LOC124443929 [Xenia sp. Carnegie-2017]
MPSKRPFKEEVPYENIFDLEKFAKSEFDRQTRTDKLCSYQSQHHDHDHLVQQVIRCIKDFQCFLPITHVAFRSWFKYTQHIHHLQWIYGEWIIRKKNKLFGKYFHLWRRWLFVSVLCRQYWVCMMKKKYLRIWQQYNKQQNLCSQRKNDANDFMKRILITKFYKIWKKKGTTKTRLLSIISGWQRLVKVREMDKLVIEQCKKIDHQNRLRKTFYRWKNFTRQLQMATRLYSNVLLKRCFLSWKTVALHRALHRKNMWTFRAKQVQLKVFHEWKRRFEHIQTARIVFQVSKKRKIKEIFNAWLLWAKESRFLRKSLHDYNYVLEKRKLKEKLLLWFAVTKEYGRLREYYHRSLQIRILRGWKYVLIQKAETQKATAAFKLFTARIMLHSTLKFWRTTTRNQQTLVEFTAARERRHLEFFFNHWHREKMNKDGEKYCARCVLKKAFRFWCKKLSKWQKTRKHFQLWKTKVAANKEQYKIAQNFCLNSHIQLMKKKFLLWRHHYENSKIAKYFKEKRSMQRSFLAWYAYFSKKKSLSNSFREFQRSHKRTNFGLIMKCFKIWQTKWILSRKADNQLQQILRSKYWKRWRHNFVKKRVSSAMVYLDNQTVLSKAFTSWYACTSASKALSKEIIILRSRRWFRTWMKRHNPS